MVLVGLAVTKGDLDRVIAGASSHDVGPPALVDVVVAVAAGVRLTAAKKGIVARFAKE